MDEHRRRAHPRVRVEEGVLRALEEADHDGADRIERRERHRTGQPRSELLLHLLARHQHRHHAQPLGVDAGLRGEPFKPRRGVRHRPRVGPRLGQFLSYQVEAALREGRLKRLLKEYEPPPLPIHIVYPHARPSSNVRAFIDLALGSLQTKPGG